MRTEAHLARLETALATFEATAATEAARRVDPLFPASSVFWGVDEGDRYIEWWDGSALIRVYDLS